MTARGVRRASGFGRAVAVGVLSTLAACKSHGAALQFDSTPLAPKPERLRGPYPTELSGAASEGERAFGAPAPFPAPLRDVMGIDYYTDFRHSEIDPVLKAKNEAEEAPMRELGRSLIAYSDGYLRSQRQSAELASAALDGLFGWAERDALLGRVNRAGLYQLKWALASYTLDYLKIRDEPALDPKKKQRVEHWFRQLADRVVAYQNANPNWPDHWNNHAYWSALAVASAGVAVGDRALFDWGIQHYDVFTSRLRPDGVLPDELGRGQRALHYHLFSIAPLVMLAELAEANGVHLYPVANRALTRLAGLCLTGLKEPNTLGAKAGVRQVSPERSDLAWLEPYYARSHDARALPWLNQRPLESGFLGGDLTLGFGVPLPETTP